MRAESTNKRMTAVWVWAVYVLSFLCYVPVLLQQHGIVVANGFFLLKYLFVCVPAISAALLSMCERNLKKYFAQMFSGKIAVRHIGEWAVFTAAGILVSYGYSLITGTDVIQNGLSVTTFLTGCIYLFLTGLVEETAWRGFLLERVSAGKNSLSHILFVGILWTIWHMPMWIIRNSLGIGQIIYLCIWTVLVSIVLGITYYECRNVLLVAVLHATFNISYSAPVPYNIAVLAIIIAVGARLYGKKKRKGSEEENRRRDRC